MDIIFTTAFKPIQRERWTAFPRTNQEYYQGLYNLADKIPYTLIVYVDPHIKEELTHNKVFKDNIVFRDLDEVDTFYKRYLERDKKVMESDIYKQKIPFHRKQNPEHLYSEYNLINHSKINFVQHTHTLYPGYSYYAWIDFCTINLDITNIPTHINMNKLLPKISFNLLTPLPSSCPDPNEMLASDTIYIGGAAFVIHPSYITVYADLYENKIIEFHEKMITDDDQNLVLSIYYDNPHLFELYSGAWFSLFKLLQ